MQVIKRDGTLEQFDVKKIYNSMEIACQGLNVDFELFKSNVKKRYKDKISTREIHKLAINTALLLANIKTDDGLDFSRKDFVYVASRLLLQDLHKEAAITRGYYGSEYGYADYLTFLHDAIDNGIYDSKILDYYTEEEILEVASEMRNDYDLSYDYPAMDLFSKRYLYKKDNKVYELPQEAYITIALFNAIPEKTSAERVKWAKEFYHEFAKRKISLATPYLSNLRKPNGNLSSCFIISVQDSIEGITGAELSAKLISKNGGGVGVNFSAVRASGSYIQGYKGASGGVIPWIKQMNDIAVSVNQLGKRAGAITTALDVWHMDVDSLLELQTENGDPRTKAFDVFPQVVVNDVFMERAEFRGSKWTLVCPHEVEVKLGIKLQELWGDEFRNAYNIVEKSDLLLIKKEVEASELFKHLLRVCIETGLPYVTFKDTINRLNPNKHCGYIQSANLCVESFSNTKMTKYKKNDSSIIDSALQVDELGEGHVCNLVSIVASNINSIEEFAHSTQVATRALDNCVELSMPPTIETYHHNLKYRILGIGLMGWADYIAERNIPYQKSSEEGNKILEVMQYNFLKMSTQLAKERGSYTAFEGSDYSKGIVCGKDITYFENRDYTGRYVSQEQWLEMLAQVKLGMRNGSGLAIAPNTSTSLMMGATASILPLFKKFFMNEASNGSVPIIAPKLSQKTYFSYQENANVNQNDVIKLTAAMQEWVDQGISMELLLNLNHASINIDAKFVKGLYYNAWRSGCKTVYYIRSISKKENSEEACESCAS
jgi:ribonucleoside-diphosphate reductase alpha chain